MNITSRYVIIECSTPPEDAELTTFAPTTKYFIHFSDNDLLAMLIQPLIKAFRNVYKTYG